MSEDLNLIAAQIKPGNQFFEAFAENAEVVFWAAELDTYQLVYVSPYAEQVLDLPLEAWLRPLFWQNNLYEGDLDRVLAVFATAVSSKETQHVEYRMRQADGNSIWIRDRVCVTTIEKNQYICGMMTNVTAFKMAVNYHTETPGYTSIFLEIVTLLSGNL